MIFRTLDYRENRQLGQTANVKERGIPYTAANTGGTPTPSLTQLQIDVQLIEIPGALPVWSNLGIRQRSKFLSPGPLNQLRNSKLILCPGFLFFLFIPTQHSFLHRNKNNLRPHLTLKSQGESPLPARLSGKRRYDIRIRNTIGEKMLGGWGKHQI